METNTITLIELVPSEGMWLTLSCLLEGEERIFSESVYLAKTDSPDNWIEWTNTQKDEYETTVLATNLD